MSRVCAFLTILFLASSCKYSGSVVGNGIKGDFNLDGVVDKVDLTYAMGCTGLARSKQGINRFCQAVDLNQDGKLNLQDLNEMEEHYEPRSVKRSELNEQDFAHLYQCLTKEYGDLSTCMDADFNGDDQINSLDMDQLKQRYVPNLKAQLLDMNADGSLDFVGDVTYFAICFIRRSLEPFASTVDPCFKANLSVVVGNKTDMVIDNTDLLQYTSLIHKYQTISEQCLSALTCGATGRELMHTIGGFIDQWAARLEILDLNSDGQFDIADLGIMKACGTNSLSPQQCRVADFTKGNNDYRVDIWDLFRFIKLMSLYRENVNSSGGNLCVFPENCHATDDEFNWLVIKYFELGPSASP